MSDELTQILIMILLWINGLLLGYLIWSPTTNFKRAFIDGMTFQWLIKLLKKRRSRT